MSMAEDVELDPYDWDDDIASPLDILLGDVEHYPAKGESILLKDMDDNYINNCIRRFKGIRGSEKFTTEMKIRNRMRQIINQFDNIQI